MAQTAKIFTTTGWQPTEFAVHQLATPIASSETSTAPNISATSTDPTVLPLTPLTCSTSLINETLNYFGLAILSGIIVGVLLIPAVQRFFARQIRNVWVRLFVQAVIAALFIYVANRLMLRWLAENPSCSDRYHVYRFPAKKPNANNESI